MSPRAKSEEWTIRVTSASAAVRRTAAGLDRWQKSGESTTMIEIQGELDRPVRRNLRTALFTVSCDRRKSGDDPGYAIGGKTAWDVVVHLGEREFGNLLLMVMMERLATVRLETAPIRYGKGAVRAVKFTTKPVPLEDEEVGSAQGE